MIADANGNKIGERGHYPFGGTWYETGASTQFKFTSYEREAGAVSAGDLDYAVYRSHYPRLGRFTSPDPVAGNVFNPQRLNRYAYVRNDPVNLTDPLGLDPIICFVQSGYRILCNGSPGYRGGGGGGWWWSFFDASNPIGVQSVLDFGGALANAALRSGWGYDWYNLPGNWSVAAEEERHQSLITTGWDPELKCLRGVTCGGIGQRTQGQGSAADSDEARRNCIQRALEEAFGVGFKHVTDIRTQGGHLNGAFDSRMLSASQVASIKATLSQPGFGPGTRISTSQGALHVTPITVPRAETPFSVKAHVDLANPNSGLGGIIGHILGDVIGGTFAQHFLGRDIDRRCN